jgi:hypothetical protein
MECEVLGMRSLSLIAAVLLLIGEALSQEQLIGQIKVKIVTGNPARLLGGVKWRVQAGGKLLDGLGDASGHFRISLPPELHVDDKEHLIMSFVKQGYEQLIRILDCQSASQAECRNLQVKLTSLSRNLNEDENITLDSDETEILVNNRSTTGHTLYLLHNISAAAAEDTTSLIQRTFQNNITDHLQGLPVSPPPPDITPPPDIKLRPLRGVQVIQRNTEKIQLYGNRLNALAMASVSESRLRDQSGNKIVRLFFQYQTIPFHDGFEPIREVVSYTLAATELDSVTLYELSDQASKRWGLYTLLAFCVREILEFERAEPTNDQVRLARIRSYLLAERFQLGSNELLEEQYVLKLLDLIDQKLGRVILPQPLRDQESKQ